jgi:hypothetical protein
LDRESEAGTGSSEHEDGEREGSPRTISQPSLPVPLPTVLLDRKIEMLLTEWNKNPDMLFTIHPVDGTFLVWHVKYLDEYNPGIFRQVQVYFLVEMIITFLKKEKEMLCRLCRLSELLRNTAFDKHLRKNTYFCFQRLSVTIHFANLVCSKKMGFGFLFFYFLAILIF